MDKISGQSAIEYLMTYGWMLLVVAVTGGAIFGVAQSQTPDSVSGFSGSDVQIDNFGVSSDEELGLNMRSASGSEITVSRVNVSDPGTGDFVYKEFTGENRIGVGSSKVFELPNVSRSDSGNELGVEIVYDSGGLSNLSVSGTVSGSLELTESGSYEGLPEDDHQSIDGDGGGNGPQEFTVVMEAWGAEGGGANGGQGGYSYAEREIMEGEEIYVYVGESPTSGSGGWNGGGQNDPANECETSSTACGGGGASDIRTNATDNLDISESNDPRILVAGAGGGEGAFGANGGDGGGIKGLDGASDTSELGGGGDQTSGGSAGTGAQPGELVFGGDGEDNDRDGGSGGGGYYGGGGATGTPVSTGTAGGGGGSGYVGYSGNFNTTMRSGVRSGHGLVNITINGDSTVYDFDESSDPSTVQPYICEIDSGGCITN